ncbi:hypothetical protein [Microcoleus sp.]|uniref:hypothetical protein n=1 Tax=Microcoleus sp. TaxID=44472 RepID=UPI003592EF15
MHHLCSKKIRLWPESEPSEADGGEPETQRSTGEGKEAGFITPAVFNCTSELV